MKTKDNLKIYLISLCAFSIVIAGCGDLRKGAGIGAGGGSVLGGIIGAITGGGSNKITPNDSRNIEVSGAAANNDLTYVSNNVNENNSMPMEIEESVEFEVFPTLQPDPGNYTFRKVEKEAWVKHDGEKTHVSIEIDWPVQFEDGNISILQKEIIKQAFGTEGTNVETAANNYIKKLGPKIKVKNTTPDCIYEMIIAKKLSQRRGKYISFVISKYGASGYRATPIPVDDDKCIIYDISTNKILHQNDIKLSLPEENIPDFINIIENHINDPEKRETFTSLNEFPLKYVFPKDNNLVFYFYRYMGLYEPFSEFVEIPFNQMKDYFRGDDIRNFFTASESNASANNTAQSTAQQPVSSPVIGTLTAYYAKENIKANGYQVKKGELIYDNSSDYHGWIDGWILKEVKGKYKMEYVSEYDVDYPPFYIAKNKVEKKTYKINKLPVALIGNRKTFVAKDGRKAVIFKSNLNAHKYYYAGWEVDMEATRKNANCYILCYKNTYSAHEDWCLEQDNGYLITNKIIDPWYNNNNYSGECAYDFNGNLLCDQMTGENPGDFYPNFFGYIASLNAIYIEGTLYYAQ